MARMLDNASLATTTHTNTHTKHTTLVFLSSHTFLSLSLSYLLVLLVHVYLEHRFTPVVLAHTPRRDVLKVDRQLDAGG